MPGLMEMLWPIRCFSGIDESRNSAQRLLIGLGAVLMSATHFLSRSRGYDRVRRSDRNLAIRSASTKP
jgi:hypothetical protein